MRESEMEGEHCREGLEGETTREGEQVATRGSVSGFRNHANHKQLTNDSNSFQPEALLTLSKVAPSPDTFQLWLADLRRRLGTVGLRALGVPAPVVLSGKVPYNPTRRVIFHLWSALFCPSNLSNAFHLASWGRFNPDMPKDYQEAAERLLDRKNGPRRARALGMPYKPFVKPWQGKTPRRNIYAVPPLLPLL